MCHYQISSQDTIALLSFWNPSSVGIFFILPILEMEKLELQWLSCPRSQSESVAELGLAIINLVLPTSALRVETLPPSNIIWGCGENRTPTLGADLKGVPLWAPPLKSLWHGRYSSVLPSHRSWAGIDPIPSSGMALPGRLCHGRHSPAPGRIGGECGAPRGAPGPGACTAACFSAASQESPIRQDVAASPPPPTAHPPS